MSAVQHTPAPIAEVEARFERFEQTSKALGEIKGLRAAFVIAQRFHAESKTPDESKVAYAIAMEIHGLIMDLSLATRARS